MSVLCVRSPLLVPVQVTIFASPSVHRVNTRISIQQQDLAFLRFQGSVSADGRFVLVSPEEGGLDGEQHRNRSVLLMRYDADVSVIRLCPRVCCG